MSESNGQPNINWDTVDGGEWAARDDAIARKYAGKWVVALPGRIIASGEDLETVGREGARILGIDPSTVVVQSVVHPDEWFKDYPFCTDVSAAKPAG